MLLPVRHQETLTALLHFIGRMVVSEQKIETAQDAGCDAEHCNQERYSGHGYPSARVCHPLSEGNDQKRRAPVDCSVFKLQWRSECVKRDGTASPAFVMTFGPAPAAIRNRLVARECSEHQLRIGWKARQFQYRKQRSNHAINKVRLMHAPTGRKLNDPRQAIAIVTGFALLIAAVVASIVASIASADAERWASHSLQVRQAATHLFGLIQDAETGQRGFLLTG